MFATLVVAAGWLIVPALAAGAAAAWHYLPGISSLPESGVESFLPQDTSAARAEEQATRLFGSSLLPRIAVVQRNPDGLSLDQQRWIVRTAVRLDQGRLPGFPAGSRALPYLNTLELVRGARERATAAITYLGFESSVSTRDQRALADRYADAVSVEGAPARTTGFIPGSLAESDAIDNGLLWVELATLLLVATVIGLYFRSLVAPVATLAAAGIAYVIAIRVTAYLAERRGLHVQNEVEPILVVLLLAIVTDYSVFFLSGMRSRLRAGEPPRVAARHATAQVLPIIVTAGLLVAAGLATLGLAGMSFVRALGPSMAIVILISLGVSITFVPAVMGLLGRALFWPACARRTRPIRSRRGSAPRSGVRSPTERAGSSARSRPFL